MCFCIVLSARTYNCYRTLNELCTILYWVFVLSVLKTAGPRENVVRKEISWGYTPQFTTENCSFLLYFVSFLIIEDNLQLTLQDYICLFH